MTSEYLRNVVAITGVAIALIATFLAAPGLIRDVTAREHARWLVTKERLKVLWMKFRDWITRRPPRSIEISVSSVAPAASGTGALSFRGSAAGSSDTSVEARLARVEAQLVDHSKRIADVGEALRNETDERQRGDAALHERVDAEIGALDTRLDHAEQESRRTNARVLPLVGFGIVLSRIPDLIALSTTTAAALIVVGLWSLHQALVHFWESGPLGIAYPKPGPNSAITT